MKTKPITAILWLAATAFVVRAAAQAADAPAPATPAPASATAAAAAAPAPSSARPAGTLRFNFRGAPLETVLNYMSEAAGYIIVLDTPVRGTVDMWSAQPVTREEAVQLLNFALNKNGYTATVQGRTLVVSSKDDAKKKNLPIRTGNDPEEIPSNAEMVMQIIPLRRLDAMQAASDLGTLLPGSAAITANADSNSLVITDTNLNLKHIVELVNALDTSADSVSAMRIFKLKNADPVEMAQLLMNVYGQSAAGQVANGRAMNGQFGGGFAGRGAVIANAFGFGGPGGAVGRGGFGGNFGNAGGRGNRNATTSRTVPVVAVADPRTYSVIVTAAKEQMPDIADMVTQLDASPARKQKVFVYTMENADVKQVETTLRNLFQSSTARTTNNNQPDALTSRATANAQTSANSTLQLGSNTTTGARGN